MDVGMMMLFASYGWENSRDDQVWGEELTLARLAAALPLPLLAPQAEAGLQSTPHPSCTPRQAFSRKPRTSVVDFQRVAKQPWPASIPWISLPFFGP